MLLFCLFMQNKYLKCKEQKKIVGNNLKIKSGLEIIWVGGSM